MIDATTTPDAPDEDEGELVRLFVLGWPERLWFTWVTVIVPAFAFGLSSLGLDLVEWKDPALGTWPALFLDRPGTLPFVPIAVLVIGVCLGLVVRPGPWACRWPVRLVLALGILLSIHFGAMAMAFFVVDTFDEGLEPLFATLIAFVLVAELSALSVRLFRWARGFVLRRYGARFLRRAGWLLALGLWFLSLVWLFLTAAGPSFLVSIFWSPLVPFIFLFCATLVVGPIWSCLALFRIQRQLGAFDPPSLRAGGLALAGLAAYLYSWRVAFYEVLQAWEKLPDQVPDCFVATAAANAPRRWVGGEQVRARGGGRQQISPQLQRLKLFELLLRHLAPGLHRPLRRFYDRVGPPLAARIRTPSRAAVAWLLLKPLEGLAMVVLGVLLGPESRKLWGRIYR